MTPLDVHALRSLTSSSQKGEGPAVLYIKSNHIPLSIITVGWPITPNYINHHP